jgi:hypothetical protein
VVAKEGWSHDKEVVQWSEVDDVRKASSEEPSGGILRVIEESYILCRSGMIVMRCPKAIVAILMLLPKVPSYFLVDGGPESP